MREKIAKRLETAWAGKTCLCFDTLPSTNDYAKELMKTETAHGTLITADRQTAGKGRRGRQWEAPTGSSILMSLCLEPKIRPEHAAGLTLVMALAAAEGIRECTGCGPMIKWPNDIVLNGKKICGILTEMCLRSGSYGVVIGIGINVNIPEFPSELAETATSLLLETGKEIPREALIAAVLKHFEYFYERFAQTEDLSHLKVQYEALLVNQGKIVRVLDAKAPYTGVAKGINDAGNLIVVCEDGTEKEVYSGEVSVRGIYGYV